MVSVFSLCIFLSNYDVTLRHITQEIHKTLNSGRKDCKII